MNKRCNKCKHYSTGAHDIECIDCGDYYGDQFSQAEENYKLNKEEHLKKLSKAFFENLIYDESCEYGSIGLNCKRPFGNSDVTKNIIEIIGLEADLSDRNWKAYSKEKNNYAENLYKNELIPYLQRKYLMGHI